MAADDLPVDGCALVIVQAEPGGTSVRADRALAGALRAFATDVHAGGAAAVLTLPSVPPELAQALMAQVAKASARRTPTTQRLLKLTRALRATILRHEPSPDAFEVAYDVCVFTMPGKA
ncbi:MAG: hypothetical protein ACRD0K_11015 [Egibacteraceae bacterium]